LNKTTTYETYNWNIDNSGIGAYHYLLALKVGTKLMEKRIQFTVANLSPGKQRVYQKIKKLINHQSMAKIYVASSWRNEFQPEVVKFLREKGHEVYDFRNPPKSTGFGWSVIDSDWEQWNTQEYVQALNHPIAKRGFASDYDGIKWADVCVMVLPCGRSANTEAGWMKGRGKRVFVYSPVRQEPELMYKLYDGISDSLSEIEGFIKDEYLNKKLVYVLKSDGQWLVKESIDAIFEYIRSTYDNLDMEDKLNCEFHLETKTMSEEELSQIPDFEG
jgi:hypothetical protein